METSFSANVSEYVHLSVNSMVNYSLSDFRVVSLVIDRVSAEHFVTGEFQRL